MKNKKNLKSIFWIVIAIIILILFYVIGHSINGKSKSNINKEFDLNNYNDEHVEIDNNSKTAVASENKDNILFQVYGDFSCSQDETIELTNSPKNDVYFKYVVTTGYKSTSNENNELEITDYGKVLYETDELIPPGKSYSWKPSDFLSKGQNKVLIITLAYDQDSNSVGGQCYPITITYN